MIKQRGFTIVELIMVIVILGIISAVAIPRFFDRKTFDERFYFEEVLSSIRYAQKLALASGCSIRIVVDSDGYRLTYAKDCGVGPTYPKINDLVADPSGGGYRGDNEYHVKIDKTFTVTFDSLGAASPSDSVEFASGSFKLAVHSTGFIEVTQ
ncbi:Tfp pilus assembly protein FimT/FimU [Stutzerimonas zhaodongensis]|uniref:pilus assembly FimT family protein n=1 Tax=Stutzerimonas zhaodongensis TaxID=1176257 RepID=UPI001F4E5EF0|nr:type II secretion system protein [Stutzerimonas zhaodongensis]UNG20334.1 type II secretion system GspH family protein [Stutzerimonas zhaodongensis]